MYSSKLYTDSFPGPLLNRCPNPATLHKKIVYETMLEEDRQECKSAVYVCESVWGIETQKEWVRNE